MATVQWEEFAQAYAFLGNSLLSPMTQTARSGIDPAFWRAFPTFGCDEVRCAAEEMAQRAETLLKDAACRLGEGADSEVVADEAALRASVEYTHLFVGPPRPAAAPWETFYRGGASQGGEAVGFGEATFAMRRQLRDLGLELRNDNNQYEDHIGIELLCLSAMCARVAEGSGPASDFEGAEPENGAEGSAACNGASPAPLSPGDVAAFIAARPLSWIDALGEKVSRERPGGYIAGLVSLSAALLRRHAALLG